jgi:hypothetical protein
MDVFTGTVQLRDLFHVLYKLSKVRRLLEGKCYEMMATEMKLLISKCGSEAIDAHSIKMNDALTQFDLIEANIKELKKACYLADDDSPCYVTATALRAIVKNA